MFAKSGGSSFYTGRNGRAILLRGPSDTKDHIKAGHYANIALGHYDEARDHSARQPRGQAREGIAVRDFAYQDWDGKHRGLQSHPWYQAR